MYLRQSTASQEVLLGPFLDDDDGITQKTGLTIANTDIQLFKAGATAFANKNSGGGVEIANGFYYAVLDATDTNTAGLLVIKLQITDCLVVRHEFNVLRAEAYDALYGSGNLPIDVQTIKGQTVTCPAGVTVGAYVGGTGAAALEATAQSILTDTGTDGVVVAESSKTGYALTAAQIDQIVDEVWDEVLTGAAHNVANSTGRRLRQLGDAVAGTVNDVAASTIAFNTNLTAADDFYNDQLILFTSGNLAGQVKAILDFANANGRITVSEALTQAPANGDDFDIIPAHVHPVSQIADGVLDEVVEGAYTMRQFLRLFASVLAAKLSGAATATVTIRDVGDTKDRVTATVDADGNRTAVVLDVT
jgi:hypothetical protein